MDEVEEELDWLEEGFLDDDEDEVLEEVLDDELLEEVGSDSSSSPPLPMLT